MEQEESKEDEGDWRRGASRGVGVGPRKEKEAPTKSRALGGEADSHREGLEPASVYACTHACMYVIAIHAGP